MILVALGANLPSWAGAPSRTLAAALAALPALGVGVVVRSECILSPPEGDRRQPCFVNAVAAVRTRLPPARLLAVLHRLEAQFGRRRRAGPRVLDLDLLDCHGRIIGPHGAHARSRAWSGCGPAHATRPLTLPHPELAVRAFVLLPLARIAPDWRHPVTGLRPAQMIAALNRNIIESQRWSHEHGGGECAPQ